MGPGPEWNGPFPATPGVDEAPDHAARAAVFVRRNPRVSIAATASGWTASWIEAAGGGGEPHRETREHLGWLMDYLEARFDREPVVHEVLIEDGSAYSVGPHNASREANLDNPDHYPVTAVCAVCGKPVRRETMEPGKLDWMHTKEA